MDLKEALRISRRPNAAAFLVKKDINDLTKQATALTPEIVPVEYHSVTSNKGVPNKPDYKKETTN